MRAPGQPLPLARYSARLLSETGQGAQNAPTISDDLALAARDHRLLQSVLARDPAADQNSRFVALQTILKVLLEMSFSKGQPGSLAGHAILIPVCIVRAPVMRSRSPATKIVPILSSCLGRSSRRGPSPLNEMEVSSIRSMCATTPDTDTVRSARLTTKPSLGPFGRLQDSWIAPVSTA
jgi:hypothetical protein